MSEHLQREGERVREEQAVMPERGREEDKRGLELLLRQRESRREEHKKSRTTAAR